MTPWQKARRWWDENTSEETFEELLGWYLSNGTIYSSPDAFMLAREVYWDGQEMHDEGDRNAWFVELAAAVGRANPVREFMRVVSHPQKYALWCRHNSFEIRAYDWAKLARKVGL